MLGIGCLEVSVGCGRRVIDMRDFGNFACSLNCFGLGVVRGCCSSVGRLCTVVRDEKGVTRLRRMSDENGMIRC